MDNIAGLPNYWSYDHEKRFITIEDTNGELVKISIARLKDCVPTILKNTTPIHNITPVTVEHILVLKAEVKRLKHALKVLSNICIANIKQSEEFMRGANE